MDVSKWIESSGLNKRSVSKRSGVARTTIDRIIKDVRPAKWDTLEEVAAACGIQLEVVASPLAEPLALEAARVLIEPGYEPSDPGAVEAWAERIKRWQDDPEDEEEFILLAARAANPKERQDLRRYRPEDLPAVLGGARDCEAAWAVSGALSTTAEIAASDTADATEAETGEDGDAGTEDPVLPTIIWAEDADEVAQLARVTPSQEGSVWLLPAPAALFAGITEDEDFQVFKVSEAQARLDGMSLEA